jgi:Gram-negative bacterial TonB protein C-terminal
VNFFRRVCVGVCLCSLIFAVPLAGEGKDNRAVEASKTYADSVEGIQAQFADLLKVVRTGDENTIHAALDTLGIPNSREWIAANFAAADVEAEAQAYQEALKKFQSHVWWVTGNCGKNPDFALEVEQSQLARPISNVGFEGLVPRPKQDVKIENFRFTSNISDPKLGKQSWVTSFLYLDGRFRMIGGTYPFWEESLNAARGPMSVPRQMIHGRVVEAAAFRNDSKREGIDGIVHIKVEIGHDGKVKKMKVLSGETEFVDDAKEYLKAAQFPALPDDPRLANAKMEWDMEVVFFTTKP